ncbi:MAG: hypothetical protein HLUCCA08_04075 [Rhodobacteraceae bacterium HLUCCA08]|nr:MAG: hypothetical protein HLUCCA08_04075 [Rhodobacteraceae bacterium HLUCCA08]
MTRYLAPAALVIALAAPVLAQPALSVDDAVPLLERIWTAEGCAFDFANRPERELGALIAAELGVETDAVMDRDGPYFHVIDDALERMADDGSFDWNDETGLITLVDCAAQ